MARITVIVTLPVSVVTVTTSGSVTRFCSDESSTFAGVNCLDSVDNNFTPSQNPSR